MCFELPRHLISVHINNPDHRSRLPCFIARAHSPASFRINVMYFQSDTYMSRFSRQSFHLPFQPLSKYIQSMATASLLLAILLMTGLSPSSHAAEIAYKEQNSGWYADKVSQAVASFFDHRRDRHFKRNGCYWEIREFHIRDRHYRGRIFKRRVTVPVKPCD